MISPYTIIGHQCAIVALRILRMILPGYLRFEEQKSVILLRHGDIASDSCAYCDHKETIDHCFLNCSRAKRVWSFFTTTLSALLDIPFRANVKTVFFYLWDPGPKRNEHALYLIKTILYGIWTFYNKTTFHNGTESSRAVVRYIKQDITTRLKVDFSRFSQDQFVKLWCHSSLRTTVNGSLVIAL